MSETMPQSSLRLARVQPPMNTPRNRRVEKALKLKELHREEMRIRAMKAEPSWSSGAIDESIIGFEETDVKKATNRARIWLPTNRKVDGKNVRVPPRTSALDKAYLYGLAWNPMMRSRGIFETTIPYDGRKYLTTLPMSHKIVWHFVHGTTIAVRETYVGNSIFPKELEGMIYAAVLDDEHESVRAALAKREDVPLKIQWRLTQNLTPQIADALANNPNVAEEIKTIAGFHLLSSPFKKSTSVFR